MRDHGKSRRVRESVDYLWCFIRIAGDVCSLDKQREDFVQVFATGESPLSATVASIFEHHFTRGIHCPIVASVLIVGRVARELHEAVVEREVMSDGVSPLQRTRPVIRKVVCDESVDLRQGHLLPSGTRDGHADESDVGIGWFTRWGFGTFALGTARLKVGFLTKRTIVKTLFFFHLHFGDFAFGIFNFRPTGVFVSFCRHSHSWLERSFLEM